MVYAFGVNLDVSMLDDVQKAKALLDRSHSGWSQLQAFAHDVKKSVSSDRELDFDQIVQVVEMIGERYVQWHSNDCRRVKEELVAKASHHEGRVQLSEVQPSHAIGRRSLFTESSEDLEKLGVLSDAAEQEPVVQLHRDRFKAKLIIPNYVNSQSMCLSTASFYTACCVNECESLLGKLEREVAA